MTRQEFLKLFELENVYKKYEKHIPFCFSLHDTLIGSKNSVYYFQDKEHKFQLVIECVEFSNETQKLELNLVLNDDAIKLDHEGLFINEIFPFLTFDTNFEAALKFIADYINKVLIPKNHLIGSVSIY